MPICPKVSTPRVRRRGRNDPARRQGGSVSRWHRTTAIDGRTGPHRLHPPVGRSYANKSGYVYDGKTLRQYNAGGRDQRT